MALIKPSPALDKITGTAGSDSFANSRYGPQMRRRTYVPDKHPSPARNKTKQDFKIVQYAWGDARPAQLKEWERYVEPLKRTNKVGVEVDVRAVDRFMKINLLRQAINEPLLLSPPPEVYPSEIQNVEIKITALSTNNDQLSTISLEDIEIFFEPAINNDTKIIVYASRTLKRGTNKPRNSWYRIIDVIDSNLLSGSSFFDQYLSAFPNCNEPPFKIAFRFRPVSITSGLSLPYFEIIERAF